MSRNKLQFIIGFLLIVMPFLGIYREWKNVFYIVAGIILILVSVTMHMNRRSHADYEETN